MHHRVVTTGRNFNGGCMNHNTAAKTAVLAAEKFTGRKWCGHCQTYKPLENGVKRIVRGRTYWKCSDCSSKR